MAALSRIGNRIAALLLVPACFPVFAVSAPPAHARIILVAESSTVVPGSDAWVGLRFEMEPGWHIYWKNPGDSGEPPRIQWHLPEGFRAGVIQWPVPQRIADHTLIDYGYEGDVLLMADLQSPKKMLAAHSAVVKATVKYLVCREVCIPGSADPTLTLPLGKRLQPSKWSGLFKQTKARLPRPAPRSWKMSAESGKDQFILTLWTGSRERQAAFFPFESNQIENAAAQVAVPLNDGVRLRLQKSTQLLPPLARLKGVVVLDGRRGFIIDVPLVSSTLVKRRLRP